MPRRSGDLSAEARSAKVEAAKAGRICLRERDRLEKLRCALSATWPSRSRPIATACRNSQLVRAAFRDANCRSGNIRINASGLREISYLRCG
jgi:hypothetical protein